jgi:hypothetical protein
MITQPFGTKKIGFELLSASTAALALCLAAPSLAGAETTKKFEPAQLREDFQVARQALEEAHPGLYRHTKKSELDRIFDNAQKSLDHPMDFYEFYRLMAPTIASIKCGHTGLGLSPEIQKDTELLPRLPFDVKVLESKPFIFRDYAKGGTLAGKEIQSINGVPAARIVSTMLTASMKDGDVQTTRQRGISGSFGWDLIVLLGLRAPYEVELSTPGIDKTKTVQVAVMNQGELVKISKTRYPQDHADEKFAEIRFLDNGAIAQLSYRQFGVNVDEGLAFMKRAFEAIQAKGSKALILDVRGNAGGESELGEVLFSYLTEKPFNYFDDLIITKNCGVCYNLFDKYADNRRHGWIVPQGMVELRADGRVHQTNEPLLTIQQPTKPVFTGPVYILIDGGCLSTTAEFLTEVDVHHRATIIGEESAGCYYGPSSPTERITLPNTKLGIYIPMVAGYMFVGGNHQHDPARGIIPDFLVKRNISDLVAGVDRDLELALKLARKSQ